MKKKSNGVYSVPGSTAGGDYYFLTAQQDKLLLTPEEIEKGFTNVRLYEAYRVIRDKLQKSGESIAKAQLAKVQKARLDGPDREKISRILDELLFSGDGSLDNPYELTECIDQILALIPTEEELRRGK